jgi:hypothetical protein
LCLTEAEWAVKEISFLRVFFAEISALSSSQSLLLKRAYRERRARWEREKKRSRGA